MLLGNTTGNLAQCSAQSSVDYYNQASSSWLQAKSEAEAAKAAVRAAVGSSKTKQSAAPSLPPPTAAGNGANGSNGTGGAASAAAAWQPQHNGGQGVGASTGSAGASTAGSGSGSSNGGGNSTGNNSRRVKGSTCSACGSPDHQVLPHSQISLPTPVQPPVANQAQFVFDQQPAAAPNTAMRQEPP